MELGVLQTIDVALRAGNGIHRPTIVDESHSSHDKEKERCLLLCIVLNLGVSKLPSQPLYSKFICCTPCISFVLVYSRLSRGCLCHLELSVLQQLKLL